MSDPAKYRTKEELNSFKEDRDPITAIKDMMQSAGIEESAIKEIDKEIKAIVNEAAEFSQESPEPDPDELWTDILVEV